MLHLQEPLHRELGLDGYIRALAEAHLVRVGLHLLEQTGFGQIAFDLLAHVEAVQADIKACCLAEGAVVVKDVDRRQIILLAQHVVVDVMRRSDLQATRTELNVDIVVLNDGNYAAHQRHDDFAAFQPYVLRVVGVYAHRGVSHDGFGARRGHYGIRLSCFFVAVNDAAFRQVLGICPPST